MTDITMPRLSDSMEEGMILQWLIEAGQPVEVGQELVEIETDKATMTYESDAAGTLEIVVPEGETVAVGEVIARVGEGAPAKADPGERDSAEAPAPAEPAAAPTPADPVPARSSNGGGDGALATPVARRLAGEHGVALEGLSGSGPLGRITKADVLAAAGLEAPPPPAVPAQPPPAPPAAAPAPAPPPSAPEPGAGPSTVEPTRIQTLIANRMTEAKATVPHFQVETEAEVDELKAARERLKGLVAEGEAAPSLNDLIVKACAIALRRHPQANGSYAAGRFELHDRVNVGIAVATEGALIVPTLTDADRKPLGQIARESRALAERVHTGAIAPPELEGATFTVSNLGMYGMTAITPVINPPQAAILGVGAIRDTLAREDGEVVDRSLLTLTLSCDHRILYGADASLFLAEVRSLLEAPLSLTY